MKDASQKDIADGVLDLIGNTPMVRLHSVAKGLQCDVLAKLEYTNPSGSTKDRIALWMIEAAEKRGLLKPGYTVVEASTGNTGIALSFVAAAKGYKMLVFMPKKAATAERKAIMESYGARVNLIDTESLKDAKDASLHGAVIEILPRTLCRDMEASDPTVWWARQFKNPDNPAAHRETTGKEILRQTKGQVNAFVASIGTGGTLMGVAQALREANPQVRIVAVEPAASPHLSKGRDGIPIIEGITDGLLFDILDQGLVDEVIPIGNDDAIAMAHQLAEQEGLFCGVSSGANVIAAIEVGEKLGAGKTVVTVLPDSRDRYLSTEKYVT